MRTLKWLIKENWEILLLFLLPVLLMLINQVWMFSNIYVDPWMYFGYFIRLKQYTIAFPGFYTGTRLPWTLPGYLLHSLFPPLIAHYILHLGLYYIAIFSLYLVLKPHVGKRGAFLASASMGCYSFFLMAVGWDYVDGAGIAYFLVTILMLSWAARKENQTIWMALSGVFFGALIYTNLAWVAFSISLITYYVLTNYPHRIKRNFISIAAFIVGFLAITILLGVVSYAIGGKFFFFVPSADFVLSSLGQLHPWKNDAHQWLGKPIWLVLPLIVLTGSLAILSLSKFSKSFEEAALPFQKTFVITCLIMIFLQIIGISVLQVPFYASYLIPSMFLAIGELLKSLTILSKYRFASVATFSLILTVSSLITVDYLVFVVADAQVIIFCLLFLAAVSFSIASSCNQKKLGGVLAVLLLTVSAIINFNAVWNVNQGGNRLQANALTSKILIDDYLTVSSVQKLFRDIDPTVSLFNWYPSKDLRESRAYDAIASASLWRNRLIGAEFPSLQPYGFPTSEPLSPQRLSELETLFTMSPKIAIFSQQKDVLQQAINSLKPLGFTAKSIATYPIKQDTIAFTITIIGVSKLKDTL